MGPAAVTAVALVIVGAGVLGVAADQPPRLGALEGKVEDFLNWWITKRDPSGATEAHLSAQVYRDDFMPAKRGAVRRYPKLGEEISVRSLDPGNRHRRGRWGRSRMGTT